MDSSDRRLVQGRRRRIKQGQGRLRRRRLGRRVTHLQAHFRGEGQGGECGEVPDPRLRRPRAGDVVRHQAGPGGLG